MITWSYSALRSFLACPYQFKRVHVDRAYRQAETERMARGRDIHEELAAAVQACATGQPLPDTEAVRQVAPLLERLCRGSAHVWAERRMGVTRDWAPCDFFAPEVWGRAVADLMCLGHDGTLVVIDWKTGERLQDDDQLLLTLAVAWAHVPEASAFAGGYYYLARHEFVRRRFSRDEIEEVRRAYLPLQQLERAVERNLWPPRPSPACRWCPVLDCRVRR